MIPVPISFISETLFDSIFSSYSHNFTFIRSNLATDDDCKRYLPMDAEAGDLYNRCKDGIIFCKLINKSAPQTIDERTINKISESGKLSLFQVLSLYFWLFHFYFSIIFILGLFNDYDKCYKLIYIINNV